MIDVPLLLKGMLLTLFGVVLSQLAREEPGSIGLPELPADVQSEVQKIYEASKRTLNHNIVDLHSKGEFESVTSDFAKKFLRGKRLTVPILKSQASDGSIAMERAIQLARMMLLCRPKHILEIGSYLGLSSHFYLKLSEPWNASLTSVDPAIPHRVFDQPRKLYHAMNDRFGSRVQTVDAFWSRDLSRGASLTWGAASGYNRPTVSGGYFAARKQKFDFAFIDGDHTEESVWRDFNAVASVMAPGGCVAFDDIPANFAPHAGSRRAVMAIDASVRRNGTGIVLWVNSWDSDPAHKPRPVLNTQCLKSLCTRVAFRVPCGTGH